MITASDHIGNDSESADSMACLALTLFHVMTYNTSKALYAMA